MYSIWAELHSQSERFLKLYLGSKEIFENIWLLIEFIRKTSKLPPIFRIGSHFISWNMSPPILGFYPRKQLGPASIQPPWWFYFKWMVWDLCENPDLNSVDTHSHSNLRAELGESWATCAYPLALLKAKVNFSLYLQEMRCFHSLNHVPLEGVSTW